MPPISTTAHAPPHPRRLLHSNTYNEEAPVRTPKPASAPTYGKDQQAGKPATKGYEGGCTRAQTLERGCDALLSTSMPSLALFGLLEVYLVSDP